jgi:hypothetical protein
MWGGEASNPCAGIIQIRFKGYDLRLLAEPPHFREKIVK